MAERDPASLIHVTQTNSTGNWSGDPACADFLLRCFEHRLIVVNRPPAALIGSPATLLLAVRGRELLLLPQGLGRVQKLFSRPRARPDRERVSLGFGQALYIRRSSIWKSGCPARTIWPSTNRTSWMTPSTKVRTSTLTGVETVPDSPPKSTSSSSLTNRCRHDGDRRPRLRRRCVPRTRPFPDPVDSAWPTGFGEGLKL